MGTIRANLLALLGDQEEQDGGAVILSGNMAASESCHSVVSGESLANFDSVERAQHRRGILLTRTGS